MWTTAMMYHNGISATAATECTRQNADGRLYPLCRHFAIWKKNIHVVFDSGLVPLLYENTTLSTKPEVHNVSHCRQRRTEPRPQVIWAENLAKFGLVIFEACERTDINFSSWKIRPSAMRPLEHLLLSLLARRTHARRDGDGFPARNPCQGREPAGEKRKRGANVNSDVAGGSCCGGQPSGRHKEQPGERYFQLGPISFPPPPHLHPHRLSAVDTAV